MGKLVFPGHIGELRYIIPAIQVYAEDGGWVSNADYIEREFAILNVNGVESVMKSDRTDYTKDAELPRYFGFVERRIPGDSKSDCRITDLGNRFYTAYVAGDSEGVLESLMLAFETCTFGKNNDGCPSSDSNLEAPNILLIASLMLDGVSRQEFAGILYEMLNNAAPMVNALMIVKMCRETEEKIGTTVRVDNKVIPFLIALNFIKDVDGRLYLSDRVKEKYAARITKLPSTNDQENRFVNFNDTDDFFVNRDSHVLQQIFFGAPGTGKSHKIDYDLFKDVNGNPFGTGLKSVPQDQKFRTTFHPDYDYAQFVGSYKPAKLKDNAGNPILVNNVPQLSYFFIPQVFAKAYVEAWTRILNNDIPEKEKPVYLVIEEINRGNCAQIFGDIFQLLDRKDGHSEYPIDVDSDFATYIRDEFGNKFTDYKKAVCSYCDDVVAAANIADEKFCKIALPPNFNIIATMNTSDQSLFPMDSAFKRRFDWEYVPIKYQKDATCSASWNADQYVIDIGGAKYSWVGFLNAVNKDIAKVTFSEDKQMGEFFVKPNKKDSEGKYTVIDLDMFRSKVLFYLWDSVYKEEVGQTKVFHFPKGNDSEDKVTFQTFFEGAKDNQIALIKKIFSNLDLIEIPNTQTTPAPVAEDVPAADTAAPEPAEAQEV